MLLLTSRRVVSIHYTVLGLSPSHKTRQNRRQFDYMDIEFIDRHCRSSVVDRKKEVTLSACHFWVNVCYRRRRIAEILLPTGLAVFLEFRLECFDKFFAAARLSAVSCRVLSLIFGCSFRWYIVVCYWLSGVGCLLLTINCRMSVPVVVVAS